MDISGLDEAVAATDAHPGFDPGLDCCHRETPLQNHAPGCFTGLGGSLEKDAPAGNNFAAAVASESTRDRLNRIEAAATGLQVANLADTNFLLSVVRRLGDQRVLGLREAVGLIRAAKNREVTTRFLVGKKEQAARSMNSKLMDTVANLIEKYAVDVEAGKL